MGWENILTLQNEGHDIESGTMTYRSLINLSRTSLDFEVGQSKQCLLNHGIKATIFAPPYNKGWNNATVINTIARYYDIAVGGFSNLMYLQCNGWRKYLNQQQSDCRPYIREGILTYANRYSIKEWNHNTLDAAYLHNDIQIFKRFVSEVNSQVTYNSNGIIIAIPIIGYHKVDNSKGRDSTDVNLFANEMKYLHDNGFKVITLSNLMYDENTKLLHIRNIPGITTAS
jgi:hypothetical protein